MVDAHALEAIPVNLAGTNLSWLADPDAYKRNVRFVDAVEPW